ncbi:FSH1-domain-containing protein [Obba rivulosa]|uniref:FSH1-domain-containing protein n=1 Tax=Obba rivulosa TaxID=1052685 RepID=A0A8E2AYK0_9APHY|nr:FSH1-domain-containing protein [Obba rivulosa]
MATSTTRKVLMLHGYAQSAAIFSKKIGAVRKACGKDINFVFVDAPHILSPVDIAATFATTNTALDDLGAAEAATESDPALTPRAWWKTDAAKTQTIGLEDSLTYLRDILKGDHYDGVFGFSQGASMAALLAALLERPEVFPLFLVDGKAPHPPFQFCVAVAGFRPRSPLCDSIFLPSFSTPTLHVLGRTDVIVVEERSKTLLDVSSNKRVEWHDGGHFVPSKASWRNFFRSYLRDPLSAIPSPGPAAVSAPQSGTATPTTAETPDA